MDHEVVPCSSKVCARHHLPPILHIQAVEFVPRQLWFTSIINVRVTLELQVPKRLIFKPTLPIVMVQYVLCSVRGKRCSLAANARGPFTNNVIFNDFSPLFCFSQTIPYLLGKKRRRLRMKKIPKPVFFGHILRKSAHPHLVHGHFSWSTFGQKSSKIKLGAQKLYKCIS